MRSKGPSLLNAYSGGGSHSRPDSGLGLHRTHTLEGGVLSLDRILDSDSIDGLHLTPHSPLHGLVACGGGI